MTSSNTPGGEALLVLDTKLKVLTANKGFYAMFRLAPEECVGQKAYELGGRAWDERLRTMLEAVLKGEPQSDHFELIHDEKAGGRGVLWLSARLVPSASPSDATVLLQIDDLTSGRPVEETLATRTQELHTFADVAGRSAHELNNLLTIIRMNADLIETILAGAGESTVEAVDIRQAAERAETITRKLLVTSRRVLPQATGLDRGASPVPLPGSPLKESAEERAERESIEAQAAKVRSLKHGEHTGRETILLVDDENALRKLGKRVLSAAGYRVLEASDGAMALRIAAEEVGEIDLILTDVEMPTLGGRGMVDELNELVPGMRVLFMSGYTDNEILHRGIRTSETDFLQKPFTAESLCAAVRTVLSKPATRLA
ncbi:MAG TPA: response regulator [Gemmatimonadaceae bacterium]|jgi:CheY-like chemotaxis protein|nr:response regulator [Gemmatimonadaceae bacterium]